MNSKYKSAYGSRTNSHCENRNQIFQVTSGMGFFWWEGGGGGQRSLHTTRVKFNPLVYFN